MSTNQKQLNISYSSILRVIAILLAIAFIYFLRDIIIILFLSMILAAALDPFVSWFERKHFPRGFGVITVYVLLFGIIALMVVALAPAIGEQGKILAVSLPTYYSQVVALFEINVGWGSGVLDTAPQTVTSLFSNIIPAVRGVFGGGLTIFLILVLTFYLSVEDRGLKRFFRSTLPVAYQPYFTRMMNRVQKKMGEWFRGQLFLSLIIFLVTAVSLFTVHMVTGELPFWLVLAVIAGVLEVVPFIGPFIAGAIAIVLVLGNSFVLAGVVALIYVIIQQLENNILVPKIMQKTVGLNPLVVILVIIVGARLAGVLGAIIAIPMAAAALVFLKDIMGGEKEEEEVQEDPA